MIEKLNKFENFDELESKLNELREAVDTSHKKLDEYDNTIRQFSDRTEVLQTKAAENGAELERQLGVVNAEKLANSFGDQAEKLRMSASLWWKRLVSWIVALFLAVLSVVVYELSSSRGFLSLGFLFRLAIASPIGYMAYYAGKQHRVETNLMHQYSF